MTPFADFERVNAIFGRLLEASAEEREQILRAECADDPDLRAHLAQLLEAAATEGGFQPGGALEGSVWNAVVEESERLEGREPEDEPFHEQIGPYRLGAEIGRGGMAVVHLAERADGEFRQSVAVKLLHARDVSGELSRRFLRERQILADLQHSNIAQLLDGGSTPSGHPYLVMEHVDGVPIDEYCDRECLSIDRRLELFLRVCAAVDFAHRRMVVHRDLKPSNILVTAAGVPKLLDFGIAKLLEPDPLTGDLTQTSALDRVLTPQYASPEQILGEPVSTATDVFALGLLLFELLTGRRARRLSSTRPSEIERTASSEVLPTPSVVVVEPGAMGGDGAILAKEVAARRRLTPPRLRKRLRGDLDNIVSMAVRREPERRYSSVEQMAEDVRRHLGARPILARPDTLGYRARKFVRRHTAGVVSTTLALLLTIGFLGFHTQRVTRERDRAEREAATAKRVTDFLLEVFTRANPADSSPGNATAIELVEQGAQSLEQNLAEEPEIQAAMEEVLGLVYLEFGRYEQAEELLRSSLEKRREVLGPRSPEVAASLYVLARVLWANGDLAGAEALSRETLALRRELLDESSLDLWLTLNDLGTVRQQQGHLAEAEDIFTEIVRMARAAYPEGHENLGVFLNNLANVRNERGEYAEAEATMREALENDRKFLPADHPSLALRLDNLASMALRGERFEDALALAEEALEMYWRVFEEPHPDMPYAMKTIAEASFAMADASRAEAMHTDALEMRLELLGPDHPDLYYSYESLGTLLLRTGRPREAKVELENALRIARSAHGEQSATYARALWNAGLAEDQLGKGTSAAALLRESVSKLAAALGEDHPEVAMKRRKLAEGGQRPAS